MNAFITQRCGLEVGSRLIKLNEVSGPGKLEKMGIIHQAIEGNIPGPYENLLLFHLSCPLRICLRDAFVGSLIIHESRLRKVQELPNISGRH